VISTVPDLPVSGMAFDGLAERYDSEFTFSHIGRLQRSVVWKRAQETFRQGSHVLELNCGTGEDALHMASLGIHVTACDASAGMIERANAKHGLQPSAARVEFMHLSIERLAELPRHCDYDGVFSNFSGLNCISDVSAVATELSTRLRPGASLLLCLSTRFCLWEMMYYLGKGNLRKALRRCSGLSQATVGLVTFPVYYPTLSSLRKSFAPGFELKSVTGVGIAVPPSYLEPWMAKRPHLLQFLGSVDEIIRGWPLARTLGDHMLLHLEKV
jgi:SAM-dependent methyltransferase